MTMTDKESVAQLLKETIVQLCKANIFYSGQVEIDGIICISGQVEGQELVIKVHEIFATPQDLRNPYAAIGYQPLGAKFLNLQNYYDDYQSGELKRRRLESAGDLRPSFAYSYLSKLIYEQNHPNSFAESSLDPGNGVTDLSIKSSLANSNRRFDLRSEGSRSPQHAVEAKYDVRSETAPAPSTHSFAARKTALAKDAWSPGKSLSPMCRVCAYSFESSEALSGHNETVHSVFTCLCCFKTFTSRSNLERHSRLHTGHRPYACDVCGKSFSRKDHLSNHATKHALKCSACLQRCPDRRALISHCLYEHGTALSDICGFCNKGFCSAELYEEHLKSHPQPEAGDPKSGPDSGKVAVRSSSRERLSCAKCSFETNDKVSLLKHQLIHSSECRLYTCLGCGKVYEDPLQYSDHLMLHQKDRDIFECCICRQVCGSLSSLRRHEAAHVADDNSDMETVAMETVAGAEGFRCGECDRTFETLAILREHLDVHALSRCHRTFENQADLELHVKTSEGLCGVAPNKNIALPGDRSGAVDGAFRRDKRKRKQPKPVSKNLSSEMDGVEGSDVEVTELMSPDVAGDFRRCDFVITDNPANVIPVSDAEIKMEPVKGILNDAATLAEQQNDLVKLENRSLVSVLPVKPNGSEDCLEGQVDRDTAPSAVRGTSRPRGRGRGRRRFASADRPDRLSALSDRLLALSEGRYSPNIPGNNDASLNNNSITARNENCPSGMDVPLGPFVCVVCSFEAVSFPVLDDHCATLHSRSPCMFCAKTFAQRANRDRHHCLHTGDKPYGCPDCDERFSRGDKLKMHRVRTHGVEYPAYGSRQRESSSRDRDFAASPVFSVFQRDGYSPVPPSVYLASLPSLAIFESHGQREVDDLRAGGDATRGDIIGQVDDRISEFRGINLNFAKNWEIAAKTSVRWEKMRPDETEIDEEIDAPNSASASN